MRSLSVALLALSLQACVVFEEPIVTNDPDAGMRERDSGPAPRDAGARDAFVPPDDDAGPPPPVDGGIEIPRRPALEACGFETPEAIATVAEPALDEVSGLAASRDNARIVWMIEDSGSAAVVHAVNDLGVRVATYRVGGTALDYEDLAIGPGPDSGVDYLYVADIGDNDGSRETITIYRAPEPVVAWDQEYVTTALERVDPIPMQYPEGERDNSEAVFVDPDTQDIYLVTKNGFSRPNTVFRLAAPHTPAIARTMERLGGVYAGVGIDIAITSAAISFDGRRIVFRALHSANYWTRPEGMSIADTIFGTDPCDAPLADEPKGESIGFGAGGYYTFSEGASQPLYFVPFEG
jgi:hypothetical protein